MAKKPLIVYAGGFWSTNIGNAFFDLGCLYAIKTACPEAEVIFTQEQPANFWQLKKTNPKNALDYIGDINADYLVVAGPMISKNFASFWQNTLEKTAERGTKLILLSAGCNSYDEEEKRRVHKFMKEIKPYAIITRDKYTYDNYGYLASNSYNGICCAFFVNDYFVPYKLDMKPYVVFNFDGISEPVFNKDKKNPGLFSLFGSEWRYKLNKKPRYIRKLSSYFEIFANKKYQNVFAKYQIIRTRHSTQPSMTKILYAAPNTLASDVPYDYLNLYANAEAVFSDRVHACVPSLAFGIPTMFYGNTPRSGIFDRVGLNDIRQRPATINQDYLRAEKTNLLKYFQEVMRG